MVAEIQIQQVANNSFSSISGKLTMTNSLLSFFVISRVFQKTTNFQCFLAQLVRSKNAIIWPVLLLNRR